MNNTIKVNRLVKALCLVMAMLFLLAGCKPGDGDGATTTTTQTDSQGNVITTTTGTPQTDASGNVITTTTGTPQTDASGNVVTTTTQTDNSGNPVATTTVQDVVSNKIPYERPAGAYNYFSDARSYQIQYDAAGSLDAEKKTVTVTHGGGPAAFAGVFMDISQSYVYRAKVTPAVDGMLARLIFKGTSMTEHTYLALEEGRVRIYDCANVYKGDAIVPIEIWSLKNDDPTFTFKGGKTYDVIILSTPTGISVWIDGKQYFNNVWQDDFNGNEGSDRVEEGFVATSKPFSRYLKVDTNYIGAYYASQLEGAKLTLTDVDLYYTQAGLDKSYIDDGTDTNYVSTYEQKKFYMGSSISFPAMYENGKKFTEMVNLLKGANLNLLIPYPDGEFAKNPTGFYDAALKAGIDVIATNGAYYGPNAINETQIQADVKATRSKYSNVIGFYVWDEPRSEKFWKVRRVSQMITKVDPSAVLLTALLPSYGSYTWTTTDTEMKYTTHVTSFIDKVKPSILTMDYYPFQQHGLTANMKTNGFWKDLGYLTYQAKKNDIPYWMWISGQQEWEFGKSDKMTMEHMKMQINGSLVYGVKGILIFNANECIITNDIKKSTKYDGMTQLNKETTNIGNLLFNAERTAIYHSTGYSNPGSAYLDTLSASKVISSIPSDGQGLIVSVFTEGSKTYMVVVNKNYTAAVSGTIKLKKAYTIAEFDANANKMGSGVSASEVKYDLEAAGIQVFQLT